MENILLGKILIYLMKKTMNWKEYINVMMVRLFMTKFNGYKLSKLNSRIK